MILNAYLNKLYQLMCHVGINNNTRYIDGQSWNIKLEKSITHDRDGSALYTSFLLYPYIEVVKLL